MPQDQLKHRALIAVMGQTGSGKSTFINLATQSKTKLRVGHSHTSCTESVDAAPAFYLDGREVLLYDTPGFNDTNKTEIEILRIISAELENQYSKGVNLHGIIYIHRISDIRVGGLEKANFGIFRKLCGDKTLKNVVILTNMWSKISTKEEGEFKIRDLETMDGFFKPALEKGAQFMHHTHDTVESSHEVIRSILKNHPFPLRIQEEIVDQGKDIDKTSAGVEVDKKIAALTEMYEKKLREHIEAAEQARKERDDETRKELLEESKNFNEAIARLKQERANQADEYRRFKQDYEEKRKKDEEERKKSEESFKREIEEKRKKETQDRSRNQQALQKQIQELNNERKNDIFQSLCGTWSGKWMSKDSNQNDITLTISPTKEERGTGKGQGKDSIGSFEISNAFVSGGTLIFTLQYSNRRIVRTFLGREISVDRRCINGDWVDISWWRSGMDLSYHPEPGDRFTLNRR